MPVLRRILAKIGLEIPDGRPLYAVPVSPEEHAELEKLLSFRVAAKEILDSTGARFVLWAAERIRSSFEGGQLTWRFIFQGLNEPEDREFAVQLVVRGLRWWGREVRITDGGIHLYLYTLMAEGGLPQSLLVQSGLYQRVIKGLLRDIEAEGADIPDDLACRIAARRVGDLPQTFQTDDIIRLLADLTVALVRLRNEVPSDVPVELIDRWLDRNHPNWVQSLPLRLAKDVAEALIRPALRTEREAFIATGPLAWRALLRDDGTGVWRSVVKVAGQGVLTTAMLPQAEGHRLRFLPTGRASEKLGSFLFNAAPDERGWTLRRLGGAGTLSIPLELDAPFALSGFADGRLFGEVDIVPAFPSPEEVPSLWKEAKSDENRTDPVELTPLAENGKTRGTRAWLLSAASRIPNVGHGLSLLAPEPAAGGLLWPVTGTGEIRLGERTWRVATGAEEDSPDTRMYAYGDILPDWRVAGNGAPVFRAPPTLFGERRAGSLWSLRDADVKTRPARVLMGAIAEWVEKGAVLARLQYVALPHGARLELRETGPETLELRAEGFPSRLSLSLSAGQTTSRLPLVEGGGQLTLSTPGVPPGVVKLRLACSETGIALDLVAAWPARNGMILSPENLRLARNTPLSVESLKGWRAVSPGNACGDLQFCVDGHPSVAVRVEGEVPLAAHLPVIRSMLAHGGPDSQIRLSLIVSGKEGRRLEIRRYYQQAAVVDGHILFGLARDEHVTDQTILAHRHGTGRVELHAVDLNAPERTRHREIDVDGPLDLHAVFPESDARWLIQATFNEEIQRAVIWSPYATPHSTREDRIEKYSKEWTRLLGSPDDPLWDFQWKLIRSVGDAGDAGALDQVQALAKKPAAALALILRVPTDDLPQVLALDMAAPIFWPLLPISAFQDALNCEYVRHVRRYARVLDHSEVEIEAIKTLARRIELILTLHPELAGHFGAALVEAKFLPQLMGLEECHALFARVLIAAPEKQLAECAQEAARRFDRLPSGVKGEEPLVRPKALTFSPDVQSMIDAPLVAAEIAVGLRHASNTALVLALINLRLVDPIYFDSALPAAIALVKAR
jgi:hypothetical protein